MPAASVDGTDLGLNGRTAILDTGTTLIIAPAADALAIHQQIQGAQSDGQGGFIIPCTTTASVALTFGQTTFAIDPRDLAFAPLDPNDPTGEFTINLQKCGLLTDIQRIRQVTVYLVSLLETLEEQTSGLWAMSS